jgi:hypothetical protein
VIPYRKVYPVHVLPADLRAESRHLEHLKLVLFEQGNDGRSTPILEDLQVLGEIAVPVSVSSLRILLARTEGNTDPSERAF